MPSKKAKKQLRIKQNIKSFKCKKCGKKTSSSHPATAKKKLCKKCRTKQKLNKIADKFVKAEKEHKREYTLTMNTALKRLKLNKAKIKQYKKMIIGLEDANKKLLNLKLTGGI